MFDLIVFSSNKVQNVSIINIANLMETFGLDKSENENIRKIANIVIALADILKKAESGSVLKGAVIRVTAKDNSFKFAESNLSLGTDAAKVSVTNKKIEFKTGTTATTIQNLPDGVYEIEEIEAPDGYKKAPKATITIDNTFTAATDDSNALVTLVDKLEPKFGSLVITKTISGAPLNELETLAFEVTSKDSNAKKVTVPDLKFANVGTIVGEDWIKES